MLCSQCLTTAWSSSQDAGRNARKGREPAPRTTVVAHIGTLTMAYAARAHGRPFYVAAPHYAFSTTHHLDAAAQTRVRAVPAPGSPRSTTSPSAPPVLVERPLRDATPPQLITLLLTDVGVLTPSAVADEMLERQRR